MRTPALFPVLLVLGMLCSGCAGGLFTSDIPAAVTYVLAPPPAATDARVTAASEADLTVGLPDVAPGLDTQRIAVLRGRQLDYFRDARWGGSTAEIVQAMLVGTLHDQRIFRSVAPEQARIAAHYMLDVEVRRFQAEYRGPGAPQVSVALLGRIVRIEDRRLVGTVSAATEHGAADNRMSAVAAAFESAAHQVALELAGHAAELIARDMRRGAPPASSAGSSTPF